MRLLVTRPEPGASETAALLRERGHTVLVQSLLTMSFSAPPDDLPWPGALLVSSQNGARALERWRIGNAWRDIPVLAGGSATAEVLAGLGFGDVRAAAGDARSLADLAIATLSKKVGPLLYPAARNRAAALAEMLVAQGYDVRTVEAYRAEPTRHLAPAVKTAFVAGAIEGVLLYSRRTAMALCDLAEEEGITEMLAAPTYFVISERVGAVLGTVAGKVRIAARPEQSALLALIPS